MSATTSEIKERQRCGPAAHKAKSTLIVNEAGLYWPSGMVRAMQYNPFFKNSLKWQATFTTRHSEFLTRLALDRDGLTSRLVRKLCRRVLPVYVTWWNRKQEDEIVASACKYHIIHIVKSPGIRLYRRLLELNGPRLVMDINDAVWLPSFPWADLPETLSIVHGVICENEYIAEYARLHNPHVFVVPDSPQVEVFDTFRDSIHRNPHQVVLGWIGGSQNLEPLLGILEALEPLFGRYPQLHLRVVGADQAMLPKNRYLRYSCIPRFDQVKMIREVLAFDIGLFPLMRNDDGRARGTLKALVYMSGQAAVVAENFGQNPSLIREGVNGVLASSLDEWHDKVEYLIANSEERLALADRGLDTVRRGFTAGHIFKRIIDAYDCVLAQ